MLRFTAVPDGVESLGTDAMAFARWHKGSAARSTAAQADLLPGTREIAMIVPKLW